MTTESIKVNVTDVLTVNKQLIILSANYIATLSQEEVKQLLDASGVTLDVWIAENGDTLYVPLQEVNIHDSVIYNLIHELGAAEDPIKQYMFYPDRTYVKMTEDEIYSMLISFNGRV